MKIVVLEGCDGVGKTSQAFMLAEELQKKYRVYCSREPFGAPVFDTCRFGIKQLLCDANKRLAVQGEVMLYLMSRLEQIRHLANIANDYDFAIIDRFSMSTLAYQCYGFGFDAHSLAQLEALLMPKLVPDITFILDANYSVIGGRQSTTSYYYESLGQELYDKVRGGFLEAAKDQGRCVIVDAGQTQDVVFSILMAALRANGQSSDISSSSPMAGSGAMLMPE